jgi:hypothetical protein
LVDAGRPPVGERRAQKLGHPPAHAGGVDHPHRSTGQRLGSRTKGIVESLATRPTEGRVQLLDRKASSVHR